MNKQEDSREIVVEGGDLVLPDRLIPNAVIHVRKGRIAFAGEKKHWVESGLQGEVAGKRVKHYVFKDSYLTPALAELHIHGAGGYSFEDYSNLDMNEFAGFMSKNGVGIFLPTIVYDRSIAESLAGKIRSYKRQKPEYESRIPGIYMEGPFISTVKRGGILPENIMDFTFESFREVVAESEGLLRIMTIAPEALSFLSADELPNVLYEMSNHGIIPAFGHSNAHFDDLRGIRIRPEQPLNVTHLYNGMSGISHKEPGLALWALLDGETYVELNGDGTHVHPWAVELALKVKDHDRIILISDAVPASSMEASIEATKGTSAPTLRGRPIEVIGNGVYDVESGVLVGSNLLVKDMVERMIEVHKLPVWEAVNMASMNPLRLLQLEDRGTLKRGSFADISVFDRSFERCLLQVFEGNVTHSADLM